MLEVCVTALLKIPLSADWCFIAKSNNTSRFISESVPCPASQTEKFAARFGLYIVGGWVTAVSAWIFVAFGSYIIMSMLYLVVG